jgi:hypothetical protein
MKESHSYFKDYAILFLFFILIIIIIGQRWKDRKGLLLRSDSHSDLALRLDNWILIVEIIMNPIQDGLFMWLNFFFKLFFHVKELKYFFKYFFIILIYWY